MKKLTIFLLIAILLVAVFSATSVFASNLDGVFENAFGTGTFSLTDDGFVLSGAASSGIAAQFVSGHSSYSGSVSVSLDVAAGSNITLCQFSNGTISVSNLVGCTWSSGSTLVKFVQGTTFASFDFSVSYSSPEKLPRFYNSSYGSNIPRTATYSFSSLLIDDVPVISDVVGERFNFSIPTGYALLIQGECDIIERDYAIYNSWNFYQNDARRVNGSRERVISTGNIVDGFSFDHNLTYAQAIQWIPRNANLFGSSTNYDYSDHTSLSLSSGSTFLISNPQYIGTMENVGNVQTKENNVPLTGTIYMEYTTRPTIKYIALESQIDFNQVGVYYNVFKPDVYQEEASTTTDGTDVIVTPDYTGTIVPPDGGNNGQPPYNPDETVEGVLSNFINSIRSLISTATQAISDLVNTGSSFMQSIATMFTWLPSPLLSVIIGGLTILIVVGVLKVLWR